jgi:hypothetical protein
MVVQDLGYALAVEGMNHVQSRSSALCLIALKVTDEVPANVCISPRIEQRRHLRLLGQRLLYAVLADVLNPGLDGLDEELGANVLGDGDQPDV